MVYLSRSERRRAYQQWGGTGAADGAAMAQDLFRQSQSQWRNRHGPLTHGHPNLQAAAASRVGLPHGSGTLPSPPDCCTLSAPTADLTPELLQLKRVGRLHSRYGSQLRSGAQMIARNLCNMNTATPREKSFITLCQQVVSRTIGNDQKCQQSKRRGNQLPASVVNFFESGSRSGRNQGIVLDEVEEDDGVQAQSAAPQVGDQSHELRSRTMCCDGSIFFQCSLPNPWDG